MSPRREVRLKIAWQHWAKGHVFTAMPAGQAEVLIQRGIAEYVTTPIKSPVDRMLRPNRPARSANGR